MSAIPTLATEDRAPSESFPVFEIPAASKTIAVLAAGQGFMAFPADYLPDLLNRLPPPLPHERLRQFVIRDWPLTGPSLVTVAVRRNTLPDIHTWSWAIESIERIHAFGPATQYSPENAR